MGRKSKNHGLLKMEEAEYELLREKARRGGLLSFTTLTKPDYEANWHHALTCRYLNRFLKGEITRLMVFEPPRYGKSELVSRRLPALIHGLDPNAEIMLATYNAALASDMTVDVQRIIDSDTYRDIFPMTQITPEGKASKYTRNSLEHEIMPYVDKTGNMRRFEGSYRAQGVGGSFTGRGANWCFVKGTKVSTRSGKRPIEQLVPGDEVWSYDVQANSGQFNSARVKAVSCHGVSRLVQVQTARGNRILCTPEHPIYVEQRGYIEAEALNPGDRLISEGLFARKVSPVPPDMRLLFKRIYEIKSKLSEKLQAWARRILLLQQMLKKTPQLKKPQTVCDLFGKDPVKAQKILLNLQGQIYYPHWQDAVQKNVHKNESPDRIQRLLSLLYLLIKRPNNDSPHRRKQTERSTGEPDLALSVLPQEAPPISGPDYVVSVESISSGKVDVYDIEVEGHHNFIAEGILVHNCLIDDPIKNREDADSKVFREAIWKWYSSTLRSRLEKGGRILITLTRWHEDDLAGRLLRLAKSNPEADQWTVLSLPAIKEDDSNPEDPRLLGEPLWPEKFDLASLAATRAQNSRDWSALYQQRPTAEDGNIFKAPWFKKYKVKPARFDQVIQSWDFAVKDKSGSDFTVGQVWGRIGTDKFLLAQVRGRFAFPVACQKLLDLSKAWPQAHKKLIEAKANGPAVKQTVSRYVTGIVEVEPRGDKVARANAIAPEAEGGSVWVPDPEIAPWIDDFLHEVCAFPLGTNDDQVDAMTQALDELRKASVQQRPIAGHGTGTIF